MHPNLNEEKKLWKKGYKIVVGLDEAGRGPLAGPVTAAAVTFLQYPIPNFQFLKKIKDSKKLTPKKREEFYKILTNHSQIKWGIGRVSEKVIDKMNILEATKLAMLKAIKNLESRTKDKKIKQEGFLIVDGNMKLNTSIPQKAVIKADEKVFSCAAASVLAKVSRDKIMLRFHRNYSQYGFNRHKGYPTKFHYKMLKKHGCCPIHRKSFNLAKKLFTD